VPARRLESCSENGLEKKTGRTTFFYLISALMADPFLGVFGLHRFYMGKWGTGILYLATLGLFGIGLICDFWTLNSQISELTLRRQHVR